MKKIEAERLRSALHARAMLLDEAKRVFEEFDRTSPADLSIRVQQVGEMMLAIMRLLAMVQRSDESVFEMRLECQALLETASKALTSIPIGATFVVGAGGIAGNASGNAQGGGGGGSASGSVAGTGSNGASSWATAGAGGGGAGGGVLTLDTLCRCGHKCLDHLDGEQRCLKQSKIEHEEKPGSGVWTVTEQPCACRCFERAP